MKNKGVQISVARLFGTEDPRYRVTQAMLYLDAFFRIPQAASCGWDQARASISMAAFFVLNRALLLDADKKNYAEQYENVLRNLGTLN